MTETLHEDIATILEATREPDQQTAATLDDVVIEQRRTNALLALLIDALAQPEAPEGDPNQVLTHDGLSATDLQGTAE